MVAFTIRMVNVTKSLMTLAYWFRWTKNQMDSWESLSYVPFSISVPQRQKVPNSNFWRNQVSGVFETSMGGSMCVENLVPLFYADYEMWNLKNFKLYRYWWDRRPMRGFPLISWNDQNGVGYLLALGYWYTPGQEITFFESTLYASVMQSRIPRCLRLVPPVGCAFNKKLQ